MSQIAAPLQPEVSLHAAKPRERGRLVPIVLAVTLLCGQAYLVVGRHFASILETRFLPYCLIGSFAIHFWSRPGRTERAVTGVLALVSAGAFVTLSGQFHLDWPGLVACGSFLGLASLTVLAVQTVRLAGASQKEKLDALVAGTVFGYSALFISYLLDLTTRLHPQTYDLYIYAADAGFGIPICAWIGQFVGSRPVLLHAASFVYEALPLVVSLLYAYQRSGRKEIPVKVLPAFIGGGAAAYALYNFLPVCGPHYIFGAGFPANLPAPAVHMVNVGDFARNAVPSMHLACALMIYWACGPLARWIRAAAAAFLVLTVLATIGFGEHYVVDLIAAVPYALALQSLCAPSRIAALPRSRRAIRIGFGLTVFWMALLRFGTPLFASHAFTWLSAISTLAICAMCRISLCRDSSILPLPRSR